MTDDATKIKAGGSPRLSEELGPLPERWYVVDRNGLATVCADEADARLQELQSRALYHRHAPYRAVRLVDAITVDALRAALASMTEDRDSWARQAADREQDALDLVAAERGASLATSAARWDMPRPAMTMWRGGCWRRW